MKTQLDIAHVYATKTKELILRSYAGDKGEPRVPKLKLKDGVSVEQLAESISLAAAKIADYQKTSKYRHTRWTIKETRQYLKRISDTLYKAEDLIKNHPHHLYDVWRETAPQLFNVLGNIYYKKIDEDMLEYFSKSPPERIAFLLNILAVDVEEHARTLKGKKLKTGPAMYPATELITVKMVQEIHRSTDAKLSKNAGSQLFSFMIAILDTLEFPHSESSLEYYLERAIS